MIQIAGVPYVPPLHLIGFALVHDGAPLSDADVRPVTDWGTGSNEDRR